MPKSKYPENVQDLPDDKYDQWTAVYHSARDDGDSKETAAKKAWGAINESKTTSLKKEDSEDENPCWEDYEMVGMKTKNGKKVPNCVPKKENNNRLTKTKLKKIIQQTIKEHLKESPLESRIGQINRFRIENNISMFELLEDVLEQLEPDAWNTVVKGIKEKYGYKR